MSNQESGRKISQFLQQTAVPSGAKFTYIVNGTNYTILDTDFYAGLGVTGTIEQQGDVAATPVLNTSGTVNYIRNIEDGPGVKASISAQGGIQVEHNLTQDTGGVALIVDLATDQTEFRSIQAGSGINVAASNGTIQIALSATPASTKTVIINSITDFPPPVGGIITLADDTEYAITNDITTASRLVWGDNCVISAADSSIITLTYTGSGVMFTSVNATWKLKSITASCVTGQFMSFTGSGAEIFQLENCAVDADSLGSISGIRGMQIDDLQVTALTDGFTYSGANGVVLIESVLGEIDAGTFIDLSAATFAAISITDCFTTLNGASVYMDGAASSANIDAGGLGSIHNCRFFGAGTPIQTISSNDIRWQFSLNDDITDTHKDCLMSQAANAVETVISTISVPVKLAGTWIEEHAAQFTTDATGKMTYIGVKDLHADITMSFSGAPVSGSNKDIAFYAALNGSVIAASEATVNLSAGDVKRVTVIWRSVIQNGDYIEAFTENETDTINIIVTDAVLRIG